MSKENRASRKVDDNFSELLQEFRVAQQGVQVLFAFLLTVPFTNRFVTLSLQQKWVYALALMSAACSAIMFIAPVSHHRILFHQGLKAAIVDYASLIGQLALLFMIVSMLSAIFLISNIVFGILTAILCTSFGLIFSFMLWYLVPLRIQKLNNQSD